ncbi:MAG: cytochrome c biogenesis protein CcdA [Candidatus Omnitrophota bacterium]
MSLTGNPLEILTVFGAGVMVSFTPCIYPVIPMTAAGIGAANVSGRRRRAFVLSVFYVLGMALTYSAFAVVAALSGRFFGYFQNQPATYAVAAAALTVFSLMMVDVIPWSGFRIAPRTPVRPKTVWGIILLGAASGLVVGPCTAPVLGTLLVHISAGQNMAYGILLTFIFSYGVGFSLILVGTFSGLLSMMPRSGRWMLIVKRVFAAVIFMTAVVYWFYFFKSIF